MDENHDDDTPRRSLSQAFPPQLAAREFGDR
jgi:hypothetical protein